MSMTGGVHGRQHPVGVSEKPAWPGVSRLMTQSRYGNCSAVDVIDAPGLPSPSSPIPSTGGPPQPWIAPASVMARRWCANASVSVDLLVGVADDGEGAAAGLFRRATRPSG